MTAFLNSSAFAAIKSVVLLSVLYGAVILWATLPPDWAGKNSNRGYVSSGSLLVQPFDRAALAKIFNSGRESSGLQAWLSDPELFRRFLQKARIQDRLRSKVAATYPKLAGLVNGVKIEPVYADEDVFGSAEGSAEEFARLDGGRRKRGGVPATRIVLSARADDPESARVLAKASVDLLQKVVAEYSTKDLQQQKRTISQLVDLTRKKAARIEAYLKRAESNRGTGWRDGEVRIQQLRSTQLGISEELSVLTARREALQAGPVSLSDRELSGVEALHQEMLQAQRLYAPDSSNLRRLTRRYQSSLTLTQQLARGRQMLALPELNHRIASKRELLDQLEREIVAERKLQPSAEVRRSSQSAQRELDGLSTELVDWERKILDLRVKERLALASGSLIRLREPEKGVSGFAATWASTWASSGRRFSRTSKMLPLAPFLAVVTVLCVSLWRGVHRVEGKMEEYLGAPLLASLPVCHQAGILADRGSQAQVLRPGLRRSRDGAV